MNPREHLKDDLRKAAKSVCMVGGHDYDQTDLESKLDAACKNEALTDSQVIFQFAFLVGARLGIQFAVEHKGDDPSEAWKRN